MIVCTYLQCRNSKWKFLDGVKTTGAPPPRKVIVQQCIRDKGVLEAICDYVSIFFGYVFFFFLKSPLNFSTGKSVARVS